MVRTEDLADARREPVEEPHLQRACELRGAGDDELGLRAERLNEIATAVRNVTQTVSAIAEAARQ